MATTSTVQSSAAPSASKKPEDQRSQKDLIAYRTRSRTQSVERGVDLETTSKNLSLRKTSRVSRSQLISESENEEEESQEESVEKSSKKTKSLRTLRVAGSSRQSEKPNNKKTVENSSKSVNSNKSQSLSSLRTLRSRTAVDQPSTSSNHRKQASSTPTGAIPKKRQRTSEQGQEPSVSASGSANPESTGSGGQAPNLGARLARNHSGREQQHTIDQQEDASAHAEVSSQQQTGDPPQNLLRRSSRGKGASSSSTTGSCVSFHISE